MLETSYYPGFRRRTVPSCTPADQRPTSNASLSFRGILVIILPDDDHDPLLSVSPSVEITRSFTTQPETRIRDSPALFSLLFLTNPFPFTSLFSSFPFLVFMLLYMFLISLFQSYFDNMTLLIIVVLFAIFMGIS